MQVDEVLELTTEERKLYYFLLKSLLKEEDSTDTILVSVKKIEEYLSIQDLSPNEKHEQICDSLLNIMCVPAIVNGKNIAVVKEWSLGATGANIKFSEDFLNAIDEACEYLFTYTCNLEKKNFIVT